MKAIVFYQDFSLNAHVFDKKQLVVHFDKATLIREITTKDAAAISSIPEYLMGKEDMVSAVWNIMNDLEVPVGHNDRHLFEKVGHTSMSIGDFIVFEDKEIWVAAALGWKILPPNELSDCVKQSIRIASSNDKVAQELIDKIERNEQTLTPCPYPMNQFYNYMEEVPAGTRVSTPEDCEKCDDDCGERYCLIEDPEND